MRPRSGAGGAGGVRRAGTGPGRSPPGVAAWAALLAAAWLLAACSRGTPERADAKSPRRPDAVPVTVAPVVEKAVPVQLGAIGNVQAYSTVTVRPQINGQIFRVHFREGQDVRRGELLFTIDPRPSEAALAQARATMERDAAQEKFAEANLARDLAQLENARVTDRRYAQLLAEGGLAREQSDQAHTNAEALEATVRADRAAVDNAQATVRADRAAVESARLQLEYTAIRSPMDGRTGTILAQLGNILKANETALVVINQVRPISVAFAVPEQDLPRIRTHLAAGDLTVEAVVPRQEAPPARGRLTFVDNTVDQTTGTIQLKATFPNADNALWPGQFVNVVLTLATEPRALVVPSQAVQTGQDGQYVFVVKADRTVEPRAVSVRASLDGEVVVLKGLAANETVVTDGQLRLSPGARVEARAPGTPATPR